MTKFTKLLVLTMCGAMLLGCSKEWRDDIDKINDRLDKIETTVEQMNSDIAAVKVLVTALEEKDYVTSVVELADRSGYTINFSQSGAVIIKHGTQGGAGQAAPVIGAKQDTDGKYYWTLTLDGSTVWLMVDGVKMPVTADPIAPTPPTAPVTPILGVDAQGYWTVDLQDGAGAVRMKDVNGNDVKAVGTDGGTTGSYEVIDDGANIRITVSGDSFVLPYLTFSGLTFTDGTGILYVGYGMGAAPTPAQIIKVKLPQTISTADFSAISASIIGKAGSDSDVKTSTRSIAADGGWKVTIDRPTSEDGSLVALVHLTTPTGSVDYNSLTEAERTAIITVSLVLNNGKTETVSRPVVVTEIIAGNWLNAEYIVPTPAAGAATKNIAVSLTSNISNGVLTIPAGVTAANTPVITINAAGFQFMGSLNISTPDYDGLIILQGTNTTRSVDNLTVNLPKGSFTLAAIATGTTTITTKPGTFTLTKEAKADALVIEKGSVKIMTGSVVTGTIELKDDEPVEIAGTVGAVSVTGGATSPITIAPSGTAASIDAPTAPVTVGGAVAGTIASAGITVEKEATVGGEITSTGTAPVVLHGTVSGNVIAEDAASVVVGSDAKVGDPTSSEPAIKAPNADTVEIPTTAEVNGSVSVPEDAYTHPIKIGSNGYTSLKEAVAAANEMSGTDNLVIEVSEGEYPLTIDPSAGNSDWYCRITRENITIKGTGDRDRTIVYGKTITPNGNHSTQNLITVAAPNVTIQNLTLMSKVEENKVVEVLSTVGKFTLRGCRVAPNNKVGGGSYTSGAIYAEGNTTLEITNNVFEYARVRGGMGVTANIVGNSFKGGQRWESELWPAIDLVNSGSGNAPVATIAKNSFTDVWTVSTSNIDAVINIAAGTATLSENSFPDDKIYWAASGNGKLNGVYTSEWKKDREDVKSWSVNKGIITFTTNANPTEGFYSWSGRQAAFSMIGGTNWSIECAYLRDITDGIPNKEVGLWGVVKYQSKTPSYPVLSYFKEGDSESWKYWDPATSKYIILPDAKVVAGWNKIRIVFTNGAFDYYINDAKVYTGHQPFFDTEGNVVTVSSTEVTGMIVNQRITGTEYTSQVTVPTVTLPSTR